MATAFGTAFDPAFDADGISAPAARVPARIVWLSASALWLCYFVLVTLRGLVMDLGLFEELLWRRALVTLAGILVTVAAWPILRRFDDRGIGTRVAAALAIMLPASILLAAINQQVFAPVEKRMIEQLAKEGDQPDVVATGAGVSIRRDTSGNLLVDVADPQPPAPPAPPAPPGTTATPAQPAVPARDRLSSEQLKLITQKVQDEGLLRQLTDVALGRYFLLIAWAALYLALANGERMRAAEHREGEYRRAAKAAELRSLRYQVNPHFLFNTLNSLSAQVMSGRAEEAERMIQTISSFYRHSLASDPTADVSLADEIELQRHYLAIEAVRFPERLRTEFEVSRELESACVPGMILQPLVENSIKYAVSATRRPVTIRISAREAGGMLVLTLADDGPAHDAPEIAGGTGIGLVNVRQRLAARFGSAAHVDSGPLPAGGYATVLTMPMVRSDGSCC